MKIQAGIQVSRPRELTRQLQLWNSGLSPPNYVEYVLYVLCALNGSERSCHFFVASDAALGCFSGTGSLPSGCVDLTGDEDPTDEDGDIGMGDSTGVSASLGGEIFSGGKKCQESNIGDSDNTGDGGKIVGGAIGACGGIVNPVHAYYNGSCTSKDNEDPSWSTSFKTRRTQKTSSALEVLWKTLFLLYLYLLGTL
ncbi:hypothetical protein Tco_1457606 [Tanacetum coccineum]